MSYKLKIIKQDLVLISETNTVNLGAVINCSVTENIPHVLQESLAKYNANPKDYFCINEYPIRNSEKKSAVELILKNKKEYSVSFSRLYRARKDFDILKSGLLKLISAKKVLQKDTSMYEEEVESISSEILEFDKQHPEIKMLLDYEKQ